MTTPGASPSVAKGNRTLANGGFLRPPYASPYRALARSCARCGTLITTPPELIRKDAGTLPGCKRCGNARAVAWQKSHPERLRDRKRAKLSRQRKRINDDLADRARRARQQWTGADLEIAAREDLTARQVADMLGRSYYAVRRARDRIRRGARG